MKIRSCEELSDQLDRELGWRKKELLHLRSQLKLSTSKHGATAVRAAVALGYAHLEGFFKNAATDYLAYIACQSVRLADLAPVHQARSALAEVRKKHGGSPPADPILVLVESLSILEQSGKATAKLPYKDVIKTQSNLSSHVIETILRQTGLPSSMFAVKQKQLDEGLLRSRNHVAHGQYLEVDASEVSNWIEMVVEMCERFKDELLNTAMREDWKRPAAVNIDTSSASERSGH